MEDGFRGDSRNDATRPPSGSGVFDLTNWYAACPIQKQQGVGLRVRATSRASGQGKPKKLPLSLVKLPWEFMANCSASIANELSQRQCIRPEPDDGAVSHTGEVQVFYVGRSL